MRLLTKIALVGVALLGVFGFFYPVEAVSIFTVQQGGTGWGSPGGFQSNTLLTGNGLNPIATTTIGAGLTLSGGVLSAVATQMGLASTTPWTQGNLAYVVDNGHVSSVATTTLTVTPDLSSSAALGSLVGGANTTLSFNLATAHSWTGLQTFANASSTQLTLLGKTYDRTGSLGTAGFILETTAAGPLWVATTSINNGVSSLIVPQGTFTGAITLATSTSATNGITSALTIVGSGSTLTFTPSQSGTLVISGGGTGTTTAPVSQLLYGGASGVYQSVATSTLTPSSPLTGSFTQIGSGGSLGCQTASGSQAGCLSSTDWNTFNNKQGSGFQIGTTSNVGISKLAFFSSVTPTTLDAVATSSTGSASTILALDANAHSVIPTASSTAFSSSYASSTSAFFGTLNLPNISGTQCLHSISGVVSGTGSDCGSGGGSGTVNTGTTGQVPYYAANGTAVTATSTLFIDTTSNVGIGSTTPGANLAVNGQPGSIAALMLLSTSTAAFSTSTAARFDANGYLTLNGPLTYGGITLSNSVTGTGSMVLNASPSFSGTVVGTTFTISTNVRGGTAATSNFGIQGTTSAAPTTGGNITLQPDSALTLTTFSHLGQAFGTTTPYGILTVASTSAGTGTFRPQVTLADLGAGTNLKYWGLFSKQGSFYISTSTDATYATSSVSALTIDPNGNIIANCFKNIGGTCLTSNTGTVTSVSGSGGTTGLTLTGGAITTSGTLTLGGTLIVANGGTGTTTAPVSQLLYGGAGGAYQSTATTTLSGTGAISVSNSPVVLGGTAAVISCSTCLTTAITSVGPAGQLQTGPAVTLASTTDAATGLTSGVTITATGNLITFKPTLTGTLAAANGGTGATSLSSAFSVVSNVFTANEHHSFTYATTTSWAGTTTIPLEVGYGEVWKSIRCYTDVGTLNTQVGIGSASTTMFNASTTIGIVSFSSNNTMTAGSQVKVDVGTPASSPTKITCTEADQF